jgi:hypothetical protein
MDMASAEDLETIDGLELTSMAASEPRSRHGASQTGGPQNGAAQAPASAPAPQPDIPDRRRPHLPNIDKPLRLFQTVEDRHDAVNYFAENHGLQNHADLLRWAAEDECDQVEARDDHDFPLHETSDDNVSFWKQSRNLKAVVLLIGLLSASCQGWNQSVLNGTGASYLPNNDHFLIEFCSSSTGRGLRAACRSAR